MHTVKGTVRHILFKRLLYEEYALKHRIHFLTLIKVIEEKIKIFV